MTDTTITIPPSEDTDPNAVAGLLKDYRGALSKTREQIAGVQANRGDVTQRNLAAIDEAIQGLKASRQTGPIAFDPAVSAAMSAGFLKTTPGVAGNFMSELGSAMGNAAPVIGNLEKNNRDSFAILADLQRKRGEFEAEPLKEREANLQKTSDQTLKMIEQLEAAGVKSPRPTVNPNNGDVIYPNAFGPGKYGIVRQTDPNTMYEVGGTGNKPVGSGTATQKPQGGPVPTEPAELTAYLQKTVDPEIDPNKMVNKNIDWAKLAEIASQNPQYALKLWKVMNYELDPKAITDQRRTKQGMNTILDDAMAIDRSFNYGEYGNINDNKKSWGGDHKNAQTVTSLRTSMNHIGEMMPAIAALDNGDYSLLNRVKNTIAGSTGGTEIAEFETAKKFIGDELAKYLSGGQVAQASKDEIASLFDSAKGPGALQSIVKKAIKLLEGKGVSLAESKTIDYGNRRIHTIDDLLGKNSKDVLDKVSSTDITTPEGKEAWGIKPKLPERDPGKVWNGPDGKPLVPHQSRAGDLTYQGGDPKDKRNWAKE
jgi:hypothetical protein